ncbi:MAG: hypothetical protein AAB776_02770 [Patescibacteria group bacterium]
MALPVKRQTPLREMLKLRYFRVVSVLSLLIWMITVALPSARVLPIIYGKTAVPLHYNIHIGVDTVGPWWQIYMVPVIGLVIILVNTVLARFMWTRDPVLSRIAGVATVVLQLVLLTAMIFIVYLSLQYA